jgi:plasmid stabilization system protein ParE
MKYTVFFEPLAQQDLQEAIYWYNEQKRGLGKRFYASFQNAIKSLAEHPQMYATRYKSVRTCPSIFPT